jgi:hypothetical protein
MQHRDLDIAISHDRLVCRKHGQVCQTDDSRDCEIVFLKAWVDRDGTFES